MTAASYRADEWNVNKWAWEGALKVASKGEECVIKLEDKGIGELYARAFLREGKPHPVEAVIDSSRYFVLRVEENRDGRQRHAFIGLGFRERTEAYDFRAALYDHMKYLNKKKTAEEMVQHYENASSVDYSLKEGKILVLQLKNKETGTKTKSAFFEQGLNKLSFNEKANTKEGAVSLKLPPHPPSCFSNRFWSCLVPFQSRIYFPGTTSCGRCWRRRSFQSKISFPRTSGRRGSPFQSRTCSS